MSDQDANATTSSPPPAASDMPTEDLHEVVEVYDEMSPLSKLLVLIVIVAALALTLALFHDAFWHWFEVHSGTVNESGPYYGFWSGFGSDIGEATLVVGVAAAWRHHNCHVKGCPRLGRTVEGTPYIACPKHHPAHEGKNRAVSLATIHRAHRAAKESKSKTE
jgi:hypothetical protein